MTEQEGIRLWVFQSWNISVSLNIWRFYLLVRTGIMIQMHLCVTTHVTQVDLHNVNLCKKMILSIFLCEFRNIVGLSWVFHFAIPYARARNKGQQEELYRQRSDQFSVFFSFKWFFTVHWQLAATLKNCLLCISPPELSQEARKTFCIVLFCSMSHMHIRNCTGLQCYGLQELTFYADKCRIYCQDNHNRSN